MEKGLQQVPAGGLRLPASLAPAPTYLLPPTWLHVPRTGCLLAMRADVSGTRGSLSIKGLSRKNPSRIQQRSVKEDERMNHAPACMRAYIM